MTVRLEPLPPKTILLVVTRFVFDESLVMVRLEAGDSPSPTVKEIGAVVVFYAVSWLPVSEILGGATVTVKAEELTLPSPSVTVMVMVATPC